jgi:hypothetical protein
MSKTGTHMSITITINISCGLVIGAFSPIELENYIEVNLRSNSPPNNIPKTYAKD